MKDLHYNRRKKKNIKKYLNKIGKKKSDEEDN